MLPTQTRHPFFNVLSIMPILHSESNGLIHKECHLSSTHTNYRANLKRREQVIVIRATCGVINTVTGPVYV
jgi:hypothetical protein